MDPHPSFTGRVPNQSKSKGKFLLGIMLLVPIVGLSGYRVYKKVVFDIECRGHLKRAADANTVELAKQELEVAIAHLKANNATNGYTSVLYKTPDEDIGFWYQNLNSSLEELKKLPADASSLEKSNMLIKLRETLLDEGQGTSVTAPKGMSVYPHNKSLFWLMVLATCMGVAGLYCLTSSSSITMIEVCIVIAIIGVLALS